MKRILIIEGLNPIPWQASQPQLGYRKGHKPFIRMVKPENLVNYQEALAEIVGQAGVIQAFPKGTPLDVTFLFWREREQYQGQSGKLVTANRADTTNMTKATEDALHAILWADDVDNVSVHGHTIAQGVGVTPRIAIIAADNNIELRKAAWQTWVETIETSVSPVGGVRYLEDPS